MDHPLIKLFRDCIVKLTIIKSGKQGTGFFVGPGLILTCAHVAGDIQANEPYHGDISVRWKNQENYTNATVKKWRPNDNDIALLSFSSPDIDTLPCVLIKNHILKIGDPLFSWGYPDIDFPNGEPITFGYSGETGDIPPEIKVKADRIRPGMSGAPILNLPTGTVCGMLKFTLNANTRLGGGGIPADTILDQFSDLKEIQEQFHRRDKRWLECISSIQHESSHGIPAPSLPDNCLGREELVNDLINLIFNESSDAVGVISATKIGVHGMGGIGKTVLASLVVRDPQITNCFQDGIYWLTFGQSPNLINRQAQLAKAISGQNEQFLDIQDGQARLRTLIANRRVLIVLDDVWQMNHIAAFNLLEEGSKLLITTRNANLIKGINGINFDLDLLTLDQANELLSLWSNQPQLPSQAKGIIKECGNLPLAIAMVGAMLRGKDSEDWQEVLELLQNAEIDEIEQAFPGYEHPNLIRALQASVDSLEEDLRSLYLDFAVFPENTPIPKSVLHTFWAYHGLKKNKINRKISKLVDRSLLKKDQDLLTIHDLQRDYLHFKIGKELSFRHQQLLKSYAAQIPEAHKKCLDNLKQWWQVPDDGYFFQHLCYHMKSANQIDELKQLLLSFNWLRTKLYLFDIGSLIRDFFHHTLDPDLKIVRQSLELSIHILVNHKEQLDFQLTGRLITQPSLHIKKMLSDIRAYSANFLPSTCCLTPPGGPLRKTLEGHKELVTSIATTCNVRQVVSGSFDKTLKVWNIESGEALRTLKGHKHPIQCVAITDDGKKAVSGSGGDPRLNYWFISYDANLRVWDIESGKELHTLKGHKDSIYCVEITGDGKKAISGSGDCNLKVWDLQSGKELHTLKGHLAAVRCVDITGDGKKAISGSGDDTLKVWDLQSGRELHTLKGHGNSVECVAVTDDGKLAVSGSAEFTLKVWDLQNGKELHTLRGHIGSVCCVMITGDGKKAVSGSGDSELDAFESYDALLNVWDIEKGEELHTLIGHKKPISCLTITGDGKQAISGSYDRTLRVWDLQNGKELHTLRGHLSAIYSVAITGNGKQAISGSGDRTLKVWELEKRKELQPLKSYMATADCLAITEDNKKIVSGSSDCNFNVWDLQSGKKLHILKGHLATVRCVAITSDGKKAISGSGDCTLKVWDLQSGRELHTLKGHKNSINCLAITSDGKKAVSGSSNFELDPIGSYDASLKVWDIESGKKLHSLKGHKGSICCLAITEDGKKVISGSSDCTLKAWDLQSGKKLYTLRGHEKYVTCVAIIGDGKKAVSGSYDNTLRVWDLQSGKEMNTFKGHGDGIECLGITGNGKQVISGSYDNTLRVWDLQSGKEMNTFKGHGNGVLRLAITGDGKKAVTGSYDNILKVWDLQRGALLSTFHFDNKIYDYCLDNDGSIIFIGGVSDGVHILHHQINS